MKALILLDEAGMTDIISFAIETLTGRQAEKQFQQITRARELFEQANERVILDEMGYLLADFDLVILQVAPSSPAELEKIMQCVSFLPTIFVVPSEYLGTPLAQNVLAFVNNRTLPSSLIDILQEIVRAGKLQAFEADAYSRFPTNLLLENYPLQGDLYIKLSEKKYVKLFKRGDSFTILDWKHYTQEKKVNYLYIKATETKDFLQKYESKLHALLTGDKPIPFVLGADAVAASIQLIQSDAILKDFKPEVRKLIRSQVDLTYQLIQQSPRLEQILQGMKDNERGYIANHSLMVAFVACGIANQMHWNAKTTGEKLILASFLHDLLFTDHDLAAVTTLDQLDTERFTVEQIAEYKRHPTTNSDLAKNLAELPPDVDTIILQHHESPDGEGFPRGLSAQQIAPLSAVFIVAHDIVSYFLKVATLKQKFDIAEYLNNEPEKFTKHQFKKIMAVVKNL
jgi:HD-GYP domain-containing protein (c-di-GMP phosphodiesterase class II)